MKKWMAVLLAAVITTTAVAQTQEVTEASGQKYIKGFVAKEKLATDPAYGWFHRQVKDYTPEADVGAALKKAKNTIRLLAFSGLWCDDTKYIIPRLYAITDAAGMDSSRIVMLGVDRDKKTINNMAETFNVTLVPTLIVLKDGKEVGRVVEYGKDGVFDQELKEIVTAAMKPAVKKPVAKK